MAIPLPDAFGWINLAAGLAMLAVAAVLIFVAGGGRLHRALALFLALRGGMNVLEAYGVSIVPIGAAIEDRVHFYFDVGVVFAAIAFALVFRRRYGPTPPRPRNEGAWLLVLGAGALVALGAYLRDDSLYFGDGNGPGVLALFSPLRLTLYGVIAILIARDAARADGARAEAGELVALGFALTPLYWAIPPAILDELVAAPSRGLIALLLVAAPAFALGAATVVIVHRSASRGGRRRAATGSLVLAMGAFASGFLVVSTTLVNRNLAEGLFRLLDGVWTLALPLLVAYAILRHKLFDLDVRIRWTLSRGTIAAVFVAVFFVASELAQQLFSETGGPIVGIVVAGLLVFALTPLQHFAERVAKAAVPLARPTTALSAHEKAEFYREQARLAWADGLLTRDERQMLDAARARLGISLEEAARLEAEASHAT